MTASRILIADDHELIREGFKSRIERTPGWQVCAEANNGREAVALALRHKPHVAVLDIGMPELNGIEAARQIRKACPHTKILVLTMQDSEQLIHDALVAGARGFLFKTDAVRLLTSAIEALLADKPFFSGRVSEVVLAGFLAPNENAAHHTAAIHRLTTREREIVQLLAEERTSKEIALRLGVGVKTIDAHRANIMRKLNVHSVVGLVLHAVQHGIILPR